MQPDLAQNIFEAVKTMPPEKQRQVLEFVNNLQSNANANAQRNLENFWAQIEARLDEIPPETWADAPTDGSINVDHYLYGAPKRPE